MSGQERDRVSDDDAYNQDRQHAGSSIQPSDMGGAAATQHAGLRAALTASPMKTWPVNAFIVIVTDGHV